MTVMTVKATWPVFVFGVLSFFLYDTSDASAKCSIQVQNNVAICTGFNAGGGPCGWVSLSGMGGATGWSCERHKGTGAPVASIAITKDGKKQNMKVNNN